MSESPRSRAFRRARIAFLFLILTAVVAEAHLLRRERGERRTWKSTLEVAVVILAQPGEETGPALVRRGVAELGHRMVQEKERHQGPGLRPFSFAVMGPVPWRGEFPMAPASGGIIDRTRHAIALWRVLRRVDRIAGITAESPDVRLYLLLDPPDPLSPRNLAEGSGDAGGDVGLVRARVDGGDASLALSALGHELLHCLGATDKYDAAGHAVEPAGLAEPDRRPRYPQRYAEWMVGEVPLGPGRGRLPVSLAEIRIGEVTAREIGWLE